jgi:hypothetical protein
MKTQKKNKNFHDLRVFAVESVSVISVVKYSLFFLNFVPLW